ncbi:MAG: hypothetical protein Q7U04_17420 [Bacteriovorax sp.]|nr:hypothetical protein [Bacteriovorax sp.]
MNIKNKKTNLITLICALGMTWTCSAYAASKGTNSGGGGDASETRVNEIRSDILKWIKNGGAKELELNSISYDDYVKRMTDILQPKNVVVGFVVKDNEANKELQVNVKGAPKTCRGFYSKIDSLPHILCNISRFENTSESKQYELIHHEYAGLVNVEKNKGAASDYEISTQITDYLESKNVLKLAVKTLVKLDSNLQLKLVETEKALNLCSLEMPRVDSNRVSKYRKSVNLIPEMAIRKIYLENRLTQITKITLISQQENRKNENGMFSKGSVLKLLQVYKVEAGIDSSELSFLAEIYIDDGKMRGYEFEKTDSIGRIIELGTKCFFTAYSFNNYVDIEIFNNKTNSTIYSDRLEQFTFYNTDFTIQNP